MVMNDKRRYEMGATALIVVVFSVLVLLTISVGFMRLVVQDQQRTNDDELSRGAYDSAMAGVEDGKRVLQACITNNSQSACEAIRKAECNTVHASQILSATDSEANKSEVVIQNSSGTTGGYEQAYTCVKIDRTTADYQGSLVADTSQVIPLETTGEFNEVIVSWFKPELAGAAIELGAGGSTPLPASSKWASSGKVKPPMIRAQLIQYNGQGFTMNEFDQSGGGNTLYLYPATIGASQILPANFVTDGRQPGGNDDLRSVQCNTIATPYICSVRISLPNPVNSSSSADRRAYLRLTSLYGKTDYSVEAVGTQFNDVEPAVDATGRASNVFRRVRARVQLVSPLDGDLYPRATVDLTHNFCKDFGVSTNQFVGGTCNFNLPL